MNRLCRPDPVVLIIAPDLVSADRLREWHGIDPRDGGWRAITRASQLRGWGPCPCVIAPDDWWARRGVMPGTAADLLDIVRARLASGRLRAATREEIELCRESEVAHGRPIEA